MKVAVTWEMCGFVDIDRPTMEEAIREIAENGDHYKLPENAEQENGSGKYPTSNGIQTMMTRED